MSSLKVVFFIKGKAEGNSYHASSYFICHIPGFFEGRFSLVVWNFNMSDFVSICPVGPSSEPQPKPVSPHTLCFMHAYLGRLLSSYCGQCNCCGASTPEQAQSTWQCGEDCSLSVLHMTTGSRLIGQPALCPAILPYLSFRELCCVSAMNRHGSLNAERAAAASLFCFRESQEPGFLLQALGPCQVTGNLSS